MTSIFSSVKDAIWNTPRSQTPTSYTGPSEGRYESEMQAEIRKWKGRYHGCRQQLNDVVQEHDSRYRELEQYKVACAQLAGANQSLEEKCEQQKASFVHAMHVLAERERALAHAEEKNKELAALLETRTSELSAFQDFAPSAEQVTDVRVAEMVGELNYEMAQAAASLSDDYADVTPVHDEVAQEALNILEKRVGRGVAKVLTSAGRGVEPDIAMQIAFQTCMSSRAHSIIKRWCFMSIADDDVLKVVYAGMSKNEPDHVSHKWRSLTRQYARWTQRGQTEAEKMFVEGIKELLAEVLIASGHASDKTAALSAVHEKAGTHVTEVVRLAFGLNEVVGQKLGAYEMCSMRWPYRTNFDAEGMEDGYSAVVSGAEVGPQKVRVLCTTDLGLLRVMNEKEDVLVKPKVALDTLIAPRGS